MTLTASADGISSYGAYVYIINPPVTYTTLSQVTNAMVYDSATGHFWASVPGSDSHYGNSIIEVDPTTQKILSNIPVGSEPNALAISDDNSTLYVSLNGANSVRRVNLLTRTAGSQFVITGNGFTTNPYAYSLAVQPGNPDVVAVTRQDPNDSGSTGPEIFNNGVLLPNALGNYEGLFIGFTSPTTLWSGMDFSPAAAIQCTVDGNGVTKTQTFQPTTGVLKTFGNNVIFNSGQVMDGTTGTLLGTFAVNGEYTMDLANGKSYALSFDVSSFLTNLTVFDNATFRTLATYPVPNFQLNSYAPTQNFTRFGAKGLAFRDQNFIYFVAALPGS